MTESQNKEGRYSGNSETVLFMLRLILDLLSEVFRMLVCFGGVDTARVEEQLKRVGGLQGIAHCAQKNGSCLEEDSSVSEGGQEEIYEENDDAESFDDDSAETGFAERDLEDPGYCTSLSDLYVSEEDDQVKYSYRRYKILEAKEKGEWYVVKLFFDVHSCLFAWKALPFAFLSKMFYRWGEKHKVDLRKILAKNIVSHIMKIAETDPNWYCKGRKITIRKGHKLDAEEPMLRIYGIENEWDSDVVIRGLIRRD